MPVPKRKADYFESEEGKAVIRALRIMSLDKTYNTNSSYSSNSELYPDNLIPFVDKHLNYLKNHPSTDAGQYLANLRLMSRRRK